jgi:hypothetical protein
VPPRAAPPRAVTLTTARPPAAAPSLPCARTLSPRAGNHSNTQYPDARYALARAHARGHDASSIPALLGPEGRDWLRTEFVATIQQRGKTVIDKRGASSAASAATAICDAVRDWMCGSNGEIVSMGVYTSPATAPAAVGGGCAYAVAPDLVFSLPVVCEGGGRVRVVNDLALDAFAGEMVRARWGRGEVMRMGHAQSRDGGASPPPRDDVLCSPHPCLPRPPPPPRSSPSFPCSSRRRRRSCWRSVPWHCRSTSRRRQAACSGAAAAAAAWGEAQSNAAPRGCLGTRHLPEGVGCWHAALDALLC